MTRLSLGPSIAICVVLLLIAAAPLAAADTHTITKGDKGPRASAQTWEFVPPAYGKWWGHIVNDGLRSLVVCVCDNSTGAPEEVMHERIRFAAYGAFPSGSVETGIVMMSPQHKYEITVVPNGPKGSSCTFEDRFWSPPPVVTFTVTVDHMTVTVEASSTTDPYGVIVSYDWSFGDGSVATGVTATHTYVTPATYVITLTVTYNDGSTMISSSEVDILDSRPAASFAYAQDHFTVFVDASESWDDYGIVCYRWDWGDGTVPDVTTSPNTSHTYGVPQGTVPAPPPGGPPWVPYGIFGYTYDSSGSSLSECTATITNKRTGEFLSCVSDSQGLYSVDVGYLSWWDGDEIEVTAVKGEMFGSNWGILRIFEMYLWIDVALMMPGPRVVTLTVTDTLGQTDATSHRVMIPSQPVVASFTYTVSGSTVYVDASDSTAEAGIANYTWDWGDGSAQEVFDIPTASHTYAGALSAVSNSTASGSGRRVPVEPDDILGYTYYGDGTILSGCNVTVTNTRSGEVATTVSDDNGFYWVYLYDDLAGDVIEVTAVRGAFSGMNSGVLEYAGLWYLWLDVYLAGPLITLTVTDTLGQTNSTSMDVTLDGRPTAILTVSPPTGYQTTTFTFDASDSSDDETPLSELRARWDWEDDGVWDTTWSTNKQAEHQFLQHGTYRIRLEVMDTDGLIGAASKDLLVDYWASGWIGATLDGPGTIGLGSSIAIDSSDRTHICYQNFSSNDLKYATNVDGSWTYYTLDGTTHVGSHTSIALDSRDCVHISYLDGGNNNLMYATNAGGSWVCSVLDSVGVVGRYNSITVDSNDRVHISYYDMANFDLKYATDAGGSWAYHTLDSAGDVGESTSIAVDSNNHVHISYCDGTNSDLKYATNTGGSWTYFTLDSVGSVGRYSSIAVDSNNRIHISYRDGTNYDLKYATNEGGSWTCYTLDSAEYVGMYSSIAVDTDDIVHVSYYDARNTSLKYATNEGGSWACHTLDSLGRAGDFGTSIAIDSSNKVHISYYSDASWGLKYIYQA